MDAMDRTKGRMGKDPRQVVSDVPLAGAAGRNGVVAAGESGVALRLPPQSKIAGGRAAGAGLALVGWVGMLIFIRLIMTGKDGHWRSKVPGNRSG